MMDNLGVNMNATSIQAYALEKGINFKWKTATQAQKAEIAMQMFFESTQQYAGNFAKESTETISGAFGLLKASTDSFIAGLGNKNANMANLTANVVDAFKTVVKNVKPIAMNMLSALPEALMSVFPRAGPAIIKISKTAIKAFVWIQDTGQKAISFIRDRWQQYGAKIIETAKTIYQKAADAFNRVKTVAQTAIGNIQAKFLEVKPKVTDFIGVVKDIGTRLQEAFNAAKPTIEWVFTDGLPKIVELGGKVLDKITGIYNFVSDNWLLISPIIYRVVGALAAYKAIMLATKGATLLMNAAQQAQNVIMVASTIKTGGLTAAQAALKTAQGGTTAAQWLLNKAMIVGAIKSAALSTAAWIKNTAQLVGNKVALLALKGAQLVSSGATAVMTAAQWALNAAFIASPIGWVVLGIGALIAIGVLLYKNWDTIKEKAFALWDGIKSAFGGIADWFGGIWEGVKSGFKAFVNFIIRGLNKIPEALNSLSVDIPDWVPGIGGKTLGFKLPTIPEFYKGVRNFSGGAALVGERGPELVNLPRGSDVFSNRETGSILSKTRDFGDSAMSIVVKVQNIINGPITKEQADEAGTNIEKAVEVALARIQAKHRRVSFQG